MDPLTIILAALVLALSIIIRSVDMFRFHAFGVDTFGVLLYSRWLKDGLLNFYKVGKQAAYPSFLPRLLGHLQRLLSVRAMHIIPKLFDVLTAITVFWFTLWFSGNEFGALLALLICTFSPINIINGYGIGTRNVGSFFFVLTLLTSYVTIFNTEARYAMFALAIASCVLMMLTNRIAYKSYFFLAIATLILLPLNILFGMFLLVALISFALCLLVTHGGFMNDLKGQIFLIEFFRNRKSKEKSLMKRVILVFYYDLWWCIGILAVFSGANPFLALWLCTIVALSLLWPWGEGERHIALVIAPASILAASQLSHQPFIMIPLLLLELSIIIRISIKVLQGRYLVSVDRSLLNLFNAIKGLKDDCLFLCLPPVYSTSVAFFTGKRVLYGDGTSQEGILLQAEVLDAVKTQDDVEALTSKYSVTHIFVDKREFSLAISYNHWEPIIQENRFAVFRRQN
jgi:hypothetical protein